MQKKFVVSRVTKNKLHNALSSAVGNNIRFAVDDAVYHRVRREIYSPTYTVESIIHRAMSNAVTCVAYSPQELELVKSLV